MIAILYFADAISSTSHYVTLRGQKYIYCTVRYLLMLVATIFLAATYCPLHAGAWLIFAFAIYREIVHFVFSPEIVVTAFLKH